MKKIILYMSLFCLAIIVLKANPSILNPNPEPYKEVGQSVKSAMQTAHAYSANHRMLAGYCAGDINPNQQGYLELTMSNVQDLLATMQKINSSSDQNPTTFRLIYGNLTDEATEKGALLMVVGLNNGSEILYNNSGGSLIYRLNSSIPCPRLCDITKSDIIQFGSECNHQ